MDEPNPSYSEPSRRTSSHHKNYPTYIHSLFRLPNNTITVMTVPVSRVTRALTLFALAAECSAFVLQSLHFKAPTSVGMPRSARARFSCAHCWSASRRWPAPRRIWASKGSLSMAATPKKSRGGNDVRLLLHNLPCTSAECHFVDFARCCNTTSSGPKKSLSVQFFSVSMRMCECQCLL